MNSISSSYNISYDIPRFLISSPGRQNRAGNGQMRITPGMTEPMDFVFGNQDGVALNLVPFTLKLVFWRNNNVDKELAGIGNTEIILSKEVPVVDPYLGKATVVLSGDDTFRLGQSGARSCRWGVFMLNQNGDVFACSVTESGGRHGQANIDITSGLPHPELIRGS